VASRHKLDGTLALDFPLKYLPWVLIALAVGVAAVRGGRVEREAREFYAAFFAGLIASAWHLTLYRGGYDNVLLPAYLAAALAGGLGWGWIAAGSRSTAVSAQRPARAPAPRAALVATL